MEMVEEAKILMVHQVCDKCGEGFMEYDIESAQMCHIWYPHKCDKCGWQNTYQVKFPHHRIVP